MIIKNFKKLAKTDLRRDALTIAEAGYESIAIKKLFRQDLSVDGDTLSVHGHKYNLKKFDNIYVIGLGKNSAAAAQVIESTIGPRRIQAGFVIDIAKKRMKKIKAMRGTHPLPSNQNIRATNKIVELLKNVTEKDLVVAIVCGGGSSLACRPDSLTCLELQFISSLLLRAGATIQEINTVRKHVSLIHGGYLAKEAYPATVLSLIVSDVPGDDISMVASGPLVPDRTTKSAAERIAKKYGLPPIDFLETPKDKKYFTRVTNVLIASGSTVVDAMAKKAQELGYKPIVYSRQLSGLAKDVGPAMAKKVKPGQALLACGETEVVVTRPGKGGRNQDVVLSAIPNLDTNSVIISAASDGKDNVPVAGGIADGTLSAKKIQKRRLDPVVAVNNNRSYKTLHSLRDHIFIQKITANISDFVIVLKK